jgi:hypothetical protein
MKMKLVGKTGNRKLKTKVTFNKGSIKKCKNTKAM